MLGLRRTPRSTHHDPCSPGRLILGRGYWTRLFRAGPPSIRHVVASPYPAIAVHQAKLGCVPRLVATDAGFYSARNETAAKAMGVKRVCIPNRASRSPERKRQQKKRWFRNGQKWRTGCEGRISVVKRRNGLNRCRYKGDHGMQRWVGLGVISDNLVNIGLVMSKRDSA